MELARSKAREKAMIILYQMSLYKKNKIDYNVKGVINDNLDFEDEFVNSLVYGVVEKEEELEDIANKYLNNWKINRLGLTDQAIMKVGIYELMYTDTPHRVCMDEAIELAHMYSDEKVVKMINGVMDKVYHNECKDN